MEIKDAIYIEIKGEKSILCVINGKHSGVPLDPNNRHYAEILRQVKEGTLTIKDAD